MHPRRTAFLPQADGSRRLHHSGLPQGKSSKAFFRVPRRAGQPRAIATVDKRRLVTGCYAASSTGAGPAMADNLSIDRRTSALLVMDFQTLIAARQRHR